MNKKDVTAKKIIALAYLHRYGWIVILMVCIIIRPTYMLYSSGAGCVAFSIWSFVGYKCKWKHIYCSFQNAYHQKMTPHSVHWNQIKKSDAYGVPLIFLVLGLAGLSVAITTSLGVVS